MAFANPTVVTTAPTAATEDTNYTYQIKATDKKGSDLKFSLATSPAGMTITANSPTCASNTCTWAATINWTPTNAQAAKSFTVSVKVVDKFNNTVSQTWTLAVANTNDPPSITSTPKTQATEDSLYTYQVTASDPDPVNDILSFALLQGPKGMTIDKSGRLSWTPTNAFVGTHSVKVRVNDPSGATDEQSFNLTVVNTNDPPVITSTAPTGANTQKLYTYQMTATDEDPTKDTFTWKLIQQPNGMTIDSKSGLVQWTPAVLDANKSFSVTAEVSDGKGGSVRQTWTIKVFHQNIAPTVTTTPLTTTKEDLLYTYTVKVSDPEKASIKFSLSTSPAGMTITKTVGKNDEAVVRWTPVNSQVGDHKISIQVDDGQGGVVFQNYTLTVTNTNDAPDVTSKAPSLAQEDTLYTYSIQAKDPDPTNDKLTFKLVSGPTGVVVDPGTGVLTWTPTNAQAEKTFKLTVEVADNFAAKTNHVFSVQVKNTNDAPNITSTAVANATEDSVYTYTVQASDIDPTKDTLTYRLVQAPNGMKIVSTTGAISWTPTNNDAIQKTVAVSAEVSDGKGGVDTQKWSITVTNTNDSPTITSKAVKGAVVGQTYQYGVTASDPDPTNDKLTFSLLQSPPKMSINPTSGLIQWLPTLADSNKRFVVSVQVSDGNGGTDKQTFDVFVIDTNRPPTISSTPSTSATEDKAYAYQIKASDPDGDKLNYVLVTSPSGMQINSGTGAINWIPSNSEVGAQNVKVRVDDGKGGVVNQSFTIQVANVNDNPVIVSSAVTKATEDSLYTYAVKATDPDPTNDKLTFRLKTAPKGMKIDASTGIVTWTPDNALVGGHAVTIEVLDGKGGTAAQSYSVVVSNVNDAPKISSKPPTAATEDTTLSYQVKASDPDPTNDKLSYRLLLGPKGMSLDLNTGLLLWTPKNADVGSHKVQVRVEDGKGGSDSQSWVLVVANVNDAPKITSTPPKGATQDKLYSYKVVATDEDPTKDTITFKLVKNPTGVLLNPTTGALTWTPKQVHVNRKHLVTVEATDGKGGKDTQSWVIEVFNSNDPPVISDKPTTKSATQGKPFQYQVKATDPDSDALVYRLLKQPAGLKINSSSGLIQWTPGNADVGNHVVTFQVDDNKGGTASHTFGLTVANVNDAPTIDSKPITAATEDKAYTYQVQASDIDPTRDTLVYSLKTSPKSMTINKSSGVLQWTPTNADVGSNPVEVVVVDGKGGSASQSFNVLVTNVNDAPVFTSKAITTATEDQNYVYLMKASDQDPTKDSLTFKLLKNPKGMTLDSSGLLQWKPTNADVGKHSVEVEVSDGNGGKSVQSFVLTVSNVNDAPEFTSTPVVLAQEKKLYSYQATAKDIDPTKDTLVFKLLKNPKSMTLNPATGLLQWTPTNADANRKHDVELEVSDGKGGTNKQAFAITVQNANDPPKITSTPKTEITMGNQYTYVIKAEDPDPAKDKLSYLLVQGPKGMKVEKDTGLLQWTPSHLDVKPEGHEITVKVIDGKGGEDTQTFKLKVLKDAKAPTASVKPFPKVNPGQYKLDATNSVDPDGATLTYEWTLMEGPVKKVDFDDATKAEPNVTLMAAGKYRFRLVADNGKFKSPPAFLEVTVNNIAPTAHAGGWLARRLRAGEWSVVGNVNEKITLDGRRSIDRNGPEPALKFSWKQEEGPKAVLAEETTSQPSFTPTAAGLYKFTLVVNDEAQDSAPVSVWVVVHDNDNKDWIPFANVQAENFVLVGSSLSLNASRSRSPSAKKLTWLWSIEEGPAKKGLTSAQKETAAFKPEAAGSYLLKLVVSDGTHRSLPVYHRVDVDASDQKLPQAKLESGYAELLTRFTLDGSNSQPSEGTPLRYEWKQVGGPIVELKDANTAQPSFFVLQSTSYRFVLVVSHSDTLKSAPVEVVVRVNTKDNKEPSADAGSPLVGDTSVNAGGDANLDGSASSDPEGEPLKFYWRQVGGYPSVLVDGDKDKAVAKPLIYGILRFELVVSDGKTFSMPGEFVDIVVNDDTNKVPVANAGEDQEVLAGVKITLDGSKSTDGDGDKLTFQWRLIKPQGVKLSLDLSNPTSPTFTIPSDTKVNEFVFGLVVDDGKSASFEDEVGIKVVGVNEAPKAVIKNPGAITVGDKVTLDGSGSKDPNPGDTLSYEWKAPGLKLTGSDKAKPTFTPTASGTFEISLTVSDGTLSNTATMKVKIDPKVDTAPNGCACSSAPHVPSSLPLWSLLLLVFLFRRRK